MLPSKPTSIHLLTVFLCFVPITQSYSSSLQRCEKIDSCSCRLDNGTEISLHFADNSENGNPIFHYHYQASKPYAYFKYSPCIGLPCGTGITNASLCLDPTLLQPASDLGSLSSATFDVSGENVSVVYTSAIGEKLQVISRVHLQCSDVERFRFDSNRTTVYNFTLFTRCACPGGCGPRRLTGEMSVGTVLVLIFFSAVTLYFGIGSLYRKAVYGGTCSEVIPHREFWVSLPPLMKDGYIFFISPCLGNRTDYKTYDKL
ncbi:hypothetical protein V1264_006094 [Littorina saxatilis]|uniref:Autophagy-related protein 27 n=1 Tax=Littorina saxatilis TaxID=31220 RepID=A0AAN9AWX9_9CAEN